MHAGSPFCFCPPVVPATIVSSQRNTPVAGLLSLFYPGLLIRENNAILFSQPKQLVSGDSCTFENVVMAGLLPCSVLGMRNKSPPPPPLRASHLGASADKQLPSASSLSWPLPRSYQLMEIINLHSLQLTRKELATLPFPLKWNPLWVPLHTRTSKFSRTKDILSH